MRTFRFAFTALATFAAFACSNSPSTTDGGTDAAGEASAMTFAQTGQIVDFSNPTSGIPNVTISGGGASVLSNAMGDYTLNVPQNKPYSMQVVGSDAGTAYVSLNEQEWMLTGNANRGTTSFVSQQTQGLLTIVLPSTPSPMLAVLSVQVEATGACAADAGGSDVTGATISVPGLSTDGGAGPVLVYFAGSPPVPTVSAKSVTAGLLPSAIIYNMPVSASFNQVTINHPTCTQKAFPVSDLTDSHIVYTGNVQLQALGAAPMTPTVSYIRVFLE
jgi:hypothetical protein